MTEKDNTQIPRQRLTLEKAVKDHLIEIGVGTKIPDEFLHELTGSNLAMLLGLHNIGHEIVDNSSPNQHSRASLIVNATNMSESEAMNILGKNAWGMDITNNTQEDKHHRKEFEKKYSKVILALKESFSKPEKLKKRKEK